MAKIILNGAVSSISEVIERFCDEEGVMDYDTVYYGADCEKIEEAFKTFNGKAYDDAKFLEKYLEIANKDLIIKD